MAFPLIAGRNSTGRALFPAPLLPLLFALVLPLQAQPDKGLEAVLALNEQLRAAIEAGPSAGATRWRTGVQRQRSRQTQQLIELRAAAFEQLMRENPGAVKSAALSEGEREALLLRHPGAADLIETAGAWSGKLEVFSSDDEGLNQQTAGFLQTDEDTLEIRTWGLPPQWQRGGYVSVMGLRLGGVVVAESVDLIPVAEMTSEGPSADAGGSCSTLGEQRSAVLVVRFPESNLGFGVADMQESFFGPSHPSLDGYMREASYGQAWLSGQAYGPYTLNGTYSCSQLAQVRQDAIAAANGDVDFLPVQRLFVVMPDLGCGWAGVASNPCSQLTSPDGNFLATTAYLRADLMLPRQKGIELATHEAGHTLGLSHSGTRDFGGEPLGPIGASGTMREFDDWFSTMGTWGLGHYNAPHKAQTLGWLTEGVNLRTVQSAGTFTLAPLSSPGSGLKALKILREPGSNSWLWVEYRQPIGPYDSTFWSSEVFYGALLHYSDPQTGYATHLLDFTPETPQWTDSVLGTSLTWNDPYGPLSITVDSSTSSGLQLSVNYGQTPCTQSTPNVRMAPDAAPVQPGGSVAFNVTVENFDSSGCPDATFSLDSTEPSGWGQSFSAPALTVPPGQVRTSTLFMPVPSGLPPGGYLANARAVRGAQAALDTAMLNVVECVKSAPSISASPVSAEVLSGGSVSFNVFVTNNDNAVSCSGATITLSAVLPSGWSGGVVPNSMSLAPGASGSAVLTVSAPSGAAAGGYSVNLSAANGGAAASAAVQAIVRSATTLDVLLSTSKTTYSAKETMTAEATVKNSGAVVSGAQVAFTLRQQGGSVIAVGTAATNAAGAAVWLYNVPNNILPGIYRLTAAATSSQGEGLSPVIELELTKGAGSTSGTGSDGGGKGKGGGPKK